MKIHSNIVAGVMVALFYFLLPSFAGSSWLDKGMGILKSFEEGTTSSQPNSNEITEAFKEALRIGTDNVAKKLGRLNGFEADPNVHIPLPKDLQTVKEALSKFGVSRTIEDLEIKLNRAAESATPRAKKVFWQAINDMTFEDIKAIYNGPKDSATKYFQKKMSPALKEEMRPIIESSMAEVGAIQAYESIMKKYKNFPLVPDVKGDLTNYVLEQALDGIFFYLAKEEAAIRENPLRQTTEILKKVFGKQ